MTAPLLSVRDLTIEFSSREGVLRALDGISFDVHAGETLGVVGESGCGKTVTALTVLGLVPGAGRVVSGEVLFEGRDLLTLSPRQMCELRGQDLAMIFQEPASSLNPVMRIGDQIAEVLRLHNHSIDRKAAWGRSIELLRSVGVADANARAREYPHQWSGGMCQRAMIAMAVANGPKLLFADEPTTALDVTIQAQVLDVLRAAQRDAGAATVLITHDLGLIAEMADRTVVMYAGQVVETGRVDDLFRAPRHPYTVGLMTSRPELETGLRRLVPISGHPPNLAILPPGCSFHPRCLLSSGRRACVEARPELQDVGMGGQQAACHFSEETGSLAAALKAQLLTGVAGGDR